MTCQVLQEEISLKTHKRLEVIDLTPTIKSWVSKHSADRGILSIYVPHTTAAIAVNEAESGLLDDILALLSELTKPDSPRWKHNIIDNNAHAHLSNILVGHSATIPVAGGALVLGTWQRILFIELDGPRDRRVFLTFIGEVL